MAYTRKQGQCECLIDLVLLNLCYNAWKRVQVFLSYHNEDIVAVGDYILTS